MNLGLDRGCAPGTSARQHKFLAAHLIAAAACVMLKPGTAFAQTEPVWPMFQFKVTGLATSVDTQVRADKRSRAIGTRFDMESAVGLDDSRSITGLDLSWRLLPRHRLQLGYFNLDRDGSRLLNKAISFQDTTYEASSQVDGRFNSRVISGSYLYSLYQTPRSEFAVGLGINQTRLLAGLGLRSGGQSSLQTVAADAPLPTLAFQYSARLGERWIGDVRGQWFGASANGVRGDLRAFNGGLTWYPWKSLGLEVGYSYWQFDLSVDRTSWSGALNYSLKGPTVSLIGAF